MNCFKAACLSLAVAAGLCACENDDDRTIDTSHLVGVWVNTHKDGQEVPTDDRFVTVYNANLTEMYAIRGSANHWKETTGYTYAIGGDTIAIAGNGTQLEYALEELSASTLEYRVARLVIGGQDLQDSSIYTLRKTSVDYSARLIGLWEGHETTDGIQGATHRWKYNADGSYQYFHAQVNGQWQTKTDNGGRYFLYGDFFVSNYRNDAETGNAGNACEAWVISIDGDTMNWTALRNNKTHSFTMTRVAP